MSATQTPTQVTSLIDSTVRSHLTPDISGNDEPSLFSREELLQFAADDSDAGRHIGAILSSLFIYTFIATSIAGWWTYRSIGH